MCFAPPCDHCNSVHVAAAAGQRTPNGVQIVGTWIRAFVRGLVRRLVMYEAGEADPTKRLS